LKAYYEDETTTIYLADNREALPLLPSESVDMVFTSPPYNKRTGNNFRVGHGGSSWKRAALAEGYESYDDAMPYEKYVLWQKSFLSEYWRVIGDSGAIYYNHKPRVQYGKLQTPLDLNPGLPVRQIVIWDRGGGYNYGEGFYMPACEWVVIFAKDGFALRDKSASAVGDVWRIAPETNTPHPAPFPLELPKRALETTTAEVILDPFMGSGTVGVACAIQGRKFIGIELSREYCDYAIARIKRAKGIPTDLPALNRCETENLPLFSAPLLNTQEAVA
jgi:site-specific DNA-methyltransferase (adenine-specific)